MNCDVKCCIVPGPELYPELSEDIREINVDSEVMDEPAGLEIGGITFIVGG